MYSIRLWHSCPPDLVFPKVEQVGRMASQGSVVLSEASGSSSAEESSGYSEETLCALVAQEFSAGSVNRALDLRRRKFFNEDIVLLQTLWPSNMIELILVSCSIKWLRIYVDS